jgi:hypothetical protein
MLKPRSRELGFRIWRFRKSAQEFCVIQIGELRAVHNEYFPIQYQVQFDKKITKIFYQTNFEFIKNAQSDTLENVKSDEFPVKIQQQGELFLAELCELIDIRIE